MPRNLNYQFLDSPKYVSTYVGAPTREYETLAKTLHDRYEVNAANISLHKQALARMNVHPKAKPILDQQLQDFDNTVKDFVDNGNIEDAGGAVLKAATDYGTNPELLNALKEKELIDKEAAKLNAQHVNKQISSWKYEHAMHKLNDDYVPNKKDAFGFYIPYTPESVPLDFNFDKALNDIITQWAADGTIGVTPVYDSNGKKMYDKITEWKGTNKAELEEALKARLKQVDAQEDLQFTAKVKNLKVDDLINDLVTPYLNKATFGATEFKTAITDPEYAIEGQKAVITHQKSLETPTQPPNNPYIPETEVSFDPAQTDEEAAIARTNLTTDDAIDNVSKYIETAVSTNGIGTTKFKRFRFDAHSAIIYATQKLPPAYKDIVDKIKLSTVPKSQIFDTPENFKTYLATVKSKVSDSVYKEFVANFNTSLGGAYAAPVSKRPFKIFNEKDEPTLYMKMQDIIKSNILTGVHSAKNKKDNGTENTYITSFDIDNNKEVIPYGITMNPENGQLTAQFFLGKKDRNGVITYVTSGGKPKLYNQVEHLEHDKKSGNLGNFFGATEPMVQTSRKLMTYRKSFDEGIPITMPYKAGNGLSYNVRAEQIGVHSYKFQVEGTNDIKYYSGKTLLEFTDYLEAYMENFK